MSQATLLTPSTVSLPPITYKGQPVITTEILAQAYGCSTKNIRDNFANNRTRFIEGKHFFTLTNGELKAFRDDTENFGVVVPARTKHFTLYTERGSLQHAKSIGTDEAWSVYDVLVETFFRVAKPKTEQPALSTASDRAPLRSLVHAWSQASGLHHTALWPQVKAHFQLSSLNDLPAEWIPDALAFVQGKIDALQLSGGKALAAPKQAALPPARPCGAKECESLMIKVMRLSHDLTALELEAGQLYGHPQCKLAREVPARLQYLIGPADRTVHNLFWACRSSLSALENALETRMLQVL